MPATERSWRAESRDAGATQWPIAHGLIATIFVAFGLAVFLLIRRATGALTAPLPPLPLVITAAAMFIWVWSVRIAWARWGKQDAVFSPRLDRLIAVWLPPVTLMLVAVACSYPGRRVVDWLVWLPVIVANSVGPHLIARWRQDVTIPARRSSPAAATVNLTESIDEVGILLQQLSRTRAADGSEMIHGTIVAEFAPGERMATLHVAFCPPFEMLPQVEAEIADGPDASVKVAQVLHNGARLDVRLTQATTDAATVSLEIVAHESAP